MYNVIIIALMLVFPAISAAIDYSLHPEIGVMAAIGRWFVFWGIGVRLGLAGIKQIAQPDFTARDIFQIQDPGAEKIVSELGFANLSFGAIGLLSLLLPAWTPAAALAGGLFLGLDGIKHARNSNRNAIENMAMVTDLFLAAVCAIYLLWWLTV